MIRGLGVVSILIALMAGGAGCAAPGARSATGADPPPAPAVAYLSALSESIVRSRAQMPRIIDSADAAAKRVTAGNHLYADGSQPEFAQELIDRAGGLEGIKPAPRRVNRFDVILYGVRSRVEAPDQAKISSWRSQGAYVVAFASAALSDNKYFPPDALIDSGPREGVALADGRICPIDSVVNVVNAWAWTGEFVAACTRFGRMPVLLQSYHRPGGRERDQRYSGQMFHDDIGISPPIGSGLLANQYFDQ